MIKRIFSTLFMLVLMSSLMLAQGSAKEKHAGFFLRFIAGGGYSGMAVDGGPTEMELSGPAGSFNFQIGTEIGKNLIAYGEIGGVTIQNPDIKIGGSTYETEDVKASAFGFGGGISYYFMPSNFYITGSVLACMAQMEYSSGSTTAKSESDTGFGIFVGAGKEWWVSDNWALGVAAFASYSSLPDKGSSDIKINTTTFGVAFSATFQ